MHEEIPLLEDLNCNFPCKVCGQKTSFRKEFCIEHLEDFMPYCEDLSYLIELREKEEQFAENAFLDFEKYNYLKKFPENSILLDDVLRHLLFIKKEGEKEGETFLNLIETTGIRPKALKGCLESLRQSGFLSVTFSPGSKKEKTYQLTRQGEEKAFSLLKKKI